MAEQERSAKGFVLGIDLGTTYSAAAIMRGSTAERCVLGTIAAQIPSVVVHRENSEILTGEAAERRAASEPTRTAREFKRRLGDPVSPPGWGSRVMATLSSTQRCPGTSR